MCSLLIGVFFLVVCDFSDSQQQITFYDDEEPEIQGRQDPNFGSYPATSWEFSQTGRTKYQPSEVGNLYAGRAEFPWLVDIRAIGDEDQTAWAPGNLLTDRHVMTTCRFVKYLETYDAEPDSLSPIIYPKEIKVLFASSYLWEDHDAPLQIRSWPREDDLPTIYTTGSRLVRLMMPHPGCDDNPVEYDVGLLELVEFIFPIPPFINYMPFGFAKSKVKLVNFNINLQKKEKINCFVASFGRNWLNWKNHMAVDFKVKYRVYVQEWQWCYNAFDKGYYNCTVPDKPGAFQLRTPCQGNFIQPGIRPERVAAGWAAAKCFNTRAPVGSVCDHDMGAPVVCNGEVIGIVTRGASQDYCSSVYPVPFVVLKIIAAADYFTNMVRAPYRFAPLKNDRPFSLEYFSGKSIAPSNKPAIIIMLVSTITQVFSRL